MIQLHPPPSLSYPAGAKAALPSSRGPCVFFVFFIFARLQFCTLNVVGHREGTCISLLQTIKLQNLIHSDTHSITESPSNEEKRITDAIQAVRFMPHFVVLENTAQSSVKAIPIKAGARLLIVKENEFRINLLGGAMLKVHRGARSLKIQHPKTEEGVKACLCTGENYRVVLGRDGEEKKKIEEKERRVVFHELWISEAALSAHRHQLTRREGRGQQHTSNRGGTER